MMALLNVAYLPNIVNSLVDMKSGGKVKKFSLNTCIFILIQTIKILKESQNLSALKFMKIIVSVLFSNKQIPSYVLKFIMDQGKAENKHEKLKKYLGYISQNNSTDDLYSYTLNNYNASINFNMFIEKCLYIDQNPNMEYFEQLKQEIDIIKQKEAQEGSAEFKKKAVGNRLQDETVRNLFVEKIGQKKMQKVQNYHR